MAGFVTGGNKPPDDIKKGLRRPKRRAKVRIDMTPMVDIAFLLLIFYMVTTVFSQPTMMQISLPSKKDNSESRRVAKSKLLMMFVDKNDFFYYQIGEDMDQPQMVEFARLAEIIKEKAYAIEDLVLLLKVDQNASYTSMVKIIDQIQSTERSVNAQIAIARKSDPGLMVKNYSARFSLQDMSAYDEYLLEAAAKGEKPKL
jgi:biopolymer transport protein ExbD